MPSLGGATEWLKLRAAQSRRAARPHRARELLDTDVHQLAAPGAVRAWSRADRNHGLVVIGVHTPEFSFEHEIDRVRQATKERGIDYPGVVDDDYEIWSAFDNHYWPALYFVDADGIIRDHHFGEGRYEQSEQVIQRLLDVGRELVSVEGLGVEAEADWDHLRTPEAYLGYARSEQFASPGRAAFDEGHVPTSSPSACVRVARSPHPGRVQGGGAREPALRRMTECGGDVGRVPPSLVCVAA
jgi:hypothetical protein